MKAAVKVEVLRDLRETRSSWVSLDDDAKQWKLRTREAKRLLTIAIEAVKKDEKKK